MKKRLRELLDANLNKALDPPKRKDPRKQDFFIGEYGDRSPDQIEDPKKIEKIDQDQPPSPAESTGQVKSDQAARSMTRQVESSRQPDLTGQVDMSGQVKPTGQVDSTGLPANSLWRSIEPGGGYCKIPNAVFDQLASLLDPAEQAVYEQLFRLSWGYGKDNCSIGFPRLSQRAGLGESTAKRAANRLIEKGLIEKANLTLGFGKEQGITFRVPLPKWAVKLIGQVESTGQVKSVGQLNMTGQVKSNPNKRDLKKQYFKIAGEKRDLLVGGSPEQIEAMMRGAVHAAGLEWDAALWREIAAARG